MCLSLDGLVRGAAPISGAPNERSTSSDPVEHMIVNAHRVGHERQGAFTAPEEHNEASLYDDPGSRFSSRVSATLRAFRERAPDWSTPRGSLRLGGRNCGITVSQDDSHP